MFKFLLFIFATSFLGACVSPPPWRTYPENNKPDYSCFVGPSEAGCDIYIWSCLNNERIAIYQCGTAFLMPSAKREAVKCDQTTPIELKYDLNVKNLTTCRKTNRAWE